MSKGPSNRGCAVRLLGGLLAIPLLLGVGVFAYGKSLNASRKAKFEDDCRSSSENTRWAIDIFYSAPGTSGKEAVIVLNENGTFSISHETRMSGVEFRSEYRGEWEYVGGFASPTMCFEVNDIATTGQGFMAERQQFEHLMRSGTTFCLDYIPLGDWDKHKGTDREQDWMLTPSAATGPVDSIHRSLRKD